MYTTLFAALAVSAAGVLVDMQFRVGGMLTYLGSLAMILWLAVTPQSPVNDNLRASLLMGFAFLTGIGCGGLVSMIYVIDPAYDLGCLFTYLTFFPSIILTAFVGTVCIFASFSAFSMFAERRTFMYLGGFLASALSVLMWIGIANMFFRLPLILNIQVYLGLIIFIGFVVFDTQLIIEKALQGNTDYVRHTLELFLDFINIFIRLLVILSKNSESKKKSNNNNSRR